QARRPAGGWLSLLARAFALLLPQVVYVQGVDEIAEYGQAVLVGLLGLGEGFAVGDVGLLGGTFAVEGDAGLVYDEFVHEYLALRADGEGDSVGGAGADLGVATVYVEGDAGEEGIV